MSITDILLVQSLHSITLIPIPPTIYSYNHKLEYGSMIKFHRAYCLYLKNIKYWYIKMTEFHVLIFIHNGRNIFICKDSHVYKGTF